MEINRKMGITIIFILIMFQMNCGHPYGRQEQSQEISADSTRIVFPTDATPTIAVPVCRGTTFCEETPYYPETLLNKAIRKTEEFKYLAGVDLVNDIVQRIDISDDTPLCMSNEQIVYPKSAENKHKKWLFVVNHRNFTQGVRIETCNERNSECNIINGFAEGYVTTCKQKYIYRQLLSIDSHGSIRRDMFRFPSSCCCHIKFTDNPFFRMGVRKSNRRD